MIRIGNQKPAGHQFGIEPYPHLILLEASYELLNPRRIMSVGVAHEDIVFRHRFGNEGHAISR